jgi:hypothetical protein
LELDEDAKVKKVKAFPFLIQGQTVKPSIDFGDSGQITSHFLRQSIFQSIDQTIKNRVLPQQGCLAKKGLEELSHSKVPERSPFSGTEI